MTWTIIQQDGPNHLGAAVIWTIIQQNGPNHLGAAVICQVIFEDPDFEVFVDPAGCNHEYKVAAATAAASALLPFVGCFHCLAAFAMCNREHKVATTLPLPCLFHCLAAFTLCVSTAEQCTAFALRPGDKEFEMNGVNTTWDLVLTVHASNMDCAPTRWP